jgi:hypothetical protein
LRDQADFTASLESTFFSEFDSSGKLWKKDTRRRAERKPGCHPYIGWGCGWMGHSLFPLLGYSENDVAESPKSRKVLVSQNGNPLSHPGLCRPDAAGGMTWLRSATWRFMSKTEQPDVFRSVTARGDFPPGRARILLSGTLGHIPGQWHSSSAVQKDASRRKRICRPPPERALCRKLQAPLRCPVELPANGRSGELRHGDPGPPPVTVFRFPPHHHHFAGRKNSARPPGRRRFPANLLSPLRSPFAIGKRYPQRAGRTGGTDGPTEVAPAPGPPSWIITSVSLSETGSEAS